MTNLFILFFLIFLLLIALIVLFILLLRISSLSFTGAPYIQIPEAVLPAIVKVLGLKGDSKLYDLGCGDGRVLIAAYRSQELDLSASDAKYIGIDNAIFPVFVARQKIKKLGLPPPINIIKKDLFKTDLTDATHIFIYLYPKLVNALLPKFERELKSGTKVVSCDYKFEKKESVQIINLNRHAGSLGKFLYVYKF